MPPVCLSQGLFNEHPFGGCFTTDWFIRLLTQLNDDPDNKNVRVGGRQYTHSNCRFCRTMSCLVGLLVCSLSPVGSRVSSYSSLSSYQLCLHLHRLHIAIYHAPEDMRGSAEGGGRYYYDQNLPSLLQTGTARKMKNRVRLGDNLKRYINFKPPPTTLDV